MTTWCSQCDRVHSDTRKEAPWRSMSQSDYRPIKDASRLERRQPKFCECGDHAWTAASQGYVVLVSPEDAGALSLACWTAMPSHGCVHICGRINNRDYYIHKILLDDPMLDHANRNGCDNRRPNLRPCSREQNLANSKPKAGGASSFKGVGRAPRGAGTWRAMIRHNGRRIYLGTYKTEREAAIAYARAAERLFGEFAYRDPRLNP